MAMASVFKRGVEVAVYWPEEPHIGVDLYEISSVSGGVVFVRYRQGVMRFDAKTGRGVRGTNLAQAIRLATDEDRAIVRDREERADLLHRIRTADVNAMTTAKLRAVVAAIDAKEG